MNSIIKRLGKICLGLGVMLVPVLGFGDGHMGPGGISFKTKPVEAEKFGSVQEVRIDKIVERQQTVNDELSDNIKAIRDEAQKAYANQNNKVGDMLSNKAERHQDVLNAYNDHVNAKTQRINDKGAFQQKPPKKMKRAKRY